MNGPQHYREAEKLLDRAIIKTDTQHFGGVAVNAKELLAAARVHVALAQVHATFSQHYTTTPAVSDWLNVFRPDDDD